jgi:hypothetical protein
MKKKGPLRNLKYSLHLVTYLDILGFRDLVSEESPNFISRAIRKVIESTEPDEIGKKQYHENYVNFSDLIVHTVPIYSQANKKYRDGLVFNRVQSLLHAQVALIQEGLLLRGALTLGNMERTYRVLFGPGLISAYDLEREKARFPRIILDSALLRELETNPHLRRHKYREEMEYLSSFLRKDTDDFFFVDYLGGLQSECHEDDYSEFLGVHKQLIEKGFSEFPGNERVLEKYRWLKKYHDETVQARLDESLRGEFLIEVRDPSDQVSP